MDFLFDASGFWIPLWQIIMINIVLSGDNAVVIAMACRELPEQQQKLGILLGSFGAIALRVILTFFAVLLLELPLLKLVGALLLVWIGVKMLLPSEDEVALDGHAQLWAAVRTVIVADFVMSLDNVIGVAAAAKGSVVLLVLGLGISIPLIIYGSTLLLTLMNRYPVIVTLGGAVLGWVAGEMLVSDPVVAPWIEANARWIHDASPTLAALLVVGTGKWLGYSKNSAEEDTPRRGEEPVSSVVAVAEAPTEEAPPPGYRWVSRRWRTLPDGTRDYAASHGKTAFKTLAPMSGRLRAPRR